MRNFADRARDEFTVRIDAHAQKIIRRGDRVMSEQPYVTPFEEYWTFGRLDEQWKLKEVLPPARAKKILAKENVDEDSSSGQLQWYYRQPSTQWPRLLKNAHLQRCPCLRQALPRVDHGAGLLRCTFCRERIYAFPTPQDCLPDRQGKGRGRLVSPCGERHF